jgi:hypothetical protein
MSATCSIVTVNDGQPRARCGLEAAGVADAATSESATTAAVAALRMTMNMVVSLPVLPSAGIGIAWCGRPVRQDDAYDVWGCPPSGTLRAAASVVRWTGTEREMTSARRATFHDPAGVS